MTATGWTFEQIDGAAMADVCDLLEYWMEEPPAHVILGWRYLERKKKPAVEEKETLQSFTELQGMMGTRPQAMPAYLKDMVAWAEEQKARLGKARAT